VTKKRQRNIRSVSEEKQRVPFFHALTGRLSGFWLLAFLPILAGTGRTGSTAAGLGLAFVVNSLLTLLFYREDKYRAREQYWRLPELTLHFWALLGGWPGAMVAQTACRHKRCKGSFMMVFRLTVILNIAVIGLLYFHPATAAYRKKAETRLYHICRGTMD